MCCFFAGWWDPFGNASVKYIVLGACRKKKQSEFHGIGKIYRIIVYYYIIPIVFIGNSDKPLIRIPIRKTNQVSPWISLSWLSFVAFVHVFGGGIGSYVNDWPGSACLPGCWRWMGSLVEISIFDRKHDRKKLTPPKRDRLAFLEGPRMSGRFGLVKWCNYIWPDWGFRVSHPKRIFRRTKGRVFYPFNEKNTFEDS